jgi:RNase P/RNase MRP subunit p29
MATDTRQMPHHDYGLDLVNIGGSWREEVWDRIGRLSDAIAPFPAGTCQQTERHVEKAHELASQRGSDWPGRRGSHIEATWRQLRLAEEALIREVPEESVPAQAELAAQTGRRYLAKGDRLLGALEERLAAEAGCSPSLLG